jgi:glycolate oxidase FAD binding subunit
MFIGEQRNSRIFQDSDPIPDRLNIPTMQATLDHFIETTLKAAENKQFLCIQGGGSKDFYGNPQALQHPKLDITPYQGIIDYEPSELVITARAGTRLKELEKTLHEHGQMLAFEPPCFNDSTTLGGCVAAGLSGPRRAYTGAVRDYVLGVKLLDGKGRIMSFGGQVMKNVAGYDISRLVVGAMGTLGVLLEVSLKVLPKPATEQTLSFQVPTHQAIEIMRRCAGEPLPVSATCHVDNHLCIRLSGAESAVQATRTKLGGDQSSEDMRFWDSIKNHTHPFFRKNKMLWRLSVKPTLPAQPFIGEQLIEWGGALRWLVLDEDYDETLIRAQAFEAGGHATLFYGNKTSIPTFHPLPPALLSIHQRLKKQFDPAGIFNPQRMYTEF